MSEQLEACGSLDDDQPTVWLEARKRPALICPHTEGERDEHSVGLKGWVLAMRLVGALFCERNTVVGWLINGLVRRGHHLMKSYSGLLGSSCSTSLMKRGSNEVCNEEAVNEERGQIRLGVSARRTRQLLSPKTSAHARGNVDHRRRPVPFLVRTSVSGLFEGFRRDSQRGRCCATALPACTAMLSSRAQSQRKVYAR